MRRVIIPPMLAALVSTALSSVDGMVFSNIGRCPHCGGPLSGYDIKKRRFAVLSEGQEHREIIVYVKRFRCKACGRISPAEAPFYPDTRYGAPVVDLCVVLARAFSYHRASRIMESMGVHMDWSTIRTYAARNFGAIPFTEIFRIPVPISVIQLSSLITGRDKGAPVERTEPFTMFPFIPADRALRDLPVPGKQGKKGNKKEQEEKRKAQAPEDETDSERGSKQSKRH